MKAQRQQKILELVTTRNIETQEQLLEQLQGAGIYCTQATISRDIRQMRIVKELTKFGNYRYTTSSQEVVGSFSSRLNSIFRDCTTSYDHAQNIVVIHTMPGFAGAAAAAVDAMRMSFVLGTIAGDDTVLIVMRDSNAAAAFCGEIKRLLD